jgi:phospho-N-acetylmuramoyl-pentapeptide-transferase
VWLLAAPMSTNGWLVWGLILGHAALGGIDDFLKIARRHHAGLRPRLKLVGQCGLALAFWIGLQVGGAPTAVEIPITGWLLLLGWWHAPLAVFVIVATTNAVNLTDGLDGLAAGTCAIALGALAWMLVVAGASPELWILALALAGGCVGFLWYNTHPAQVIMGDLGAMALGAALAGLAITAHLELYIPILGALFVAEAGSVILQVWSFQTRGVRIFRMSPLHHHFELGGWGEQQVVTRFYIVAILCAILAILAS